MPELSCLSGHFGEEDPSKELKANLEDIKVKKFHFTRSGVESAAVISHWRTLQMKMLMDIQELSCKPLKESQESRVWCQVLWTISIGSVATSLLASMSLSYSCSSLSAGYHSLLATAPSSSSMRLVGTLSTYRFGKSGI